MFKKIGNLFSGSEKIGLVFTKANFCVNVREGIHCIDDNLKPVARVQAEKLYTLEKERREK